MGIYTDVRWDSDLCPISDFFIVSISAPLVGVLLLAFGKEFLQSFDVVAIAVVVGGLALEALGPASVTVVLVVVTISASTSISPPSRSFRFWTYF